MDSFKDFDRGVSEYKLGKLDTQERPYIGKISQVQFHRGSTNLHFKNFNEDNFRTVDFLKNNHKMDISEVKTRTIPRGIKQSKKAGIIEKLSSLMKPETRVYWDNIPTNAASVDLINTRENRE